MMPAECIEQPLMVWILQATVAQPRGQLGVQGFGVGLAVQPLTVAVRVPQSQGVRQPCVELRSNVLGSAGLGRHDLADRAQQMS